MSKASRAKIQFCLLEALIIFLPFSSWLVSLTGQPAVSIIRDILFFVLFLVSIPDFKIKNFGKPVPVSILIFMLFILLSAFWTAAAPLQWLKGTRFWLTPLALLFTLIQINLGPSRVKIFVKTIISMSAMIILLAILELFGLKLPTVSALSGTGALDSVNLVGALKISRLQSVLAGPNALGLYLLVIVSALLGWRGEIKYWKLLTALSILIIIVTFSRSVWLGLLILILIEFIYRHKFSPAKISYFVITFVVLLGGLIYFAPRSPVLAQIISHGSSTDLRFDQYRRIWEVRSDIGLLGRGAGAAGPSTQNRLDTGPNYWSENTYLDTFEELGWIGLLLFAAVIITLSCQIFRAVKDEPVSRSARLILPSFLAAGFFINLFTGQVAVFMFLLILGLASVRSKQSE